MLLCFGQSFNTGEEKGVLDFRTVIKNVAKNIVGGAAENIYSSDESFYSELMCATLD